MSKTVDLTGLALLKEGKTVVRHDHNKVVEVFNDNPGASASEVAAEYQKQTGKSINTNTVRSIVKNETGEGFTGKKGNSYTQTELQHIVACYNEGMSRTEIAADVCARAQAGEEGFHNRTMHSISYVIGRIRDAQTTEGIVEEEEPLAPEPLEVTEEEEDDDIKVEEDLLTN